MTVRNLSAKKLMAKMQIRHERTNMDKHKWDLCNCAFFTFFLLAAKPSSLYLLLFSLVWQLDNDDLNCKIGEIYTGLREKYLWIFHSLLIAIDTTEGRCTCRRHHHRSNSWPKLNRDYPEWRPIGGSFPPSRHSLHYQLSWMCCHCGWARYQCQYHSCFRVTVTTSTTVVEATAHITYSCIISITWN